MQNPPLSISVVIPAYNAENTLPCCLAALARQTRPPDEVIVVDDGSTDHTAQVAREYGAKVLSCARQGPAAARNAGVESACGELILFTDADCAPVEGWVAAISRPFTDAQMVGAKGTYRTYQRSLVARFVQQEYEYKYARLARQRAIDFIDTYSAAYRRACFLQNHGFDTAFTVPSVEDQEFSFRLARKGYKLIFAPDAVVYHQHDGSVAEYVHRKCGIGYWKAYMLHWLPEKALGDSHTPPSQQWQIVLAALGFMSLVSGFIWPSALFGALMCLLLIYLTSIPMLVQIWRRDRPVLVIAPLLVLCRAIALGSGLIAGFLLPPHHASHPVEMRAEWTAIVKRMTSRIPGLLTHHGTIPASRYAFLLLLVALVLQGFLYVFLVPPWLHPDEPTHFEHARMIADTGRLPALDEVSLPLRRQIAESMLRHNFWRAIAQPPLNDQTLSTTGTSPLGIYTLSQPRLYYIVAAVWLLPWLNQPVDQQLYALRLMSVALSMIVVLCAYVAARLIFPAQRFIALTAAALITFLPGYADIMSAVNNDALANALGAVFFLLLVLLLTHRWKQLAGVGIVAMMVGTLGLSVATKATGIALVIALLVALTVGLIIRLILAKGWQVQHTALLASLMTALAVILLFVIAYQGVLGQYLSGVLEWLARYLRVNLSGTLQSLIHPSRVSYAFAAQIVFQSFWAVFGWRHIYLAPAWYWLPLATTLLAVAGLAAWGIRLARQKEALATKWREVQMIVFALVFAAVAWLLAIMRSQADQGMPNPYQSHGRYAYVAIAPFAIVFVVGVLSLLPVNWQRRGAFMVISVSVIFQVICFWGYLFPYFN